MSFRLYHIINALSLDVAFGAGVLSLVFGRYLGFRMPAPVLAVLVLTVWVIYTADHLLDAKRIQGRAASFRHHFHQHFFKPILISFCVAFIMILFLIIQIPPIVIFYGIPVSLGVVTYFILNRFFNLTFQKEFLIAVLYVIGVFIGPYSLSRGQAPVELQLLLVQLGIMAWINLLVFGLFEMKDDHSDGMKSTPLIWGEHRTGKMIRILIIGCLFIGISCVALFHENSGFFKLQVVFFGMLGVLATLYYRRTRIAESGLSYRYFGDGIFYMPVAYFWF